MKPIMKYLNLPALAISALLIASCGGGGGGDDGGTPSSSVSLTSSNAKSVSAEVLDSSETVQGATAGPAILTGVSVETTTIDFNYTEFVVQQLIQVESQGVVPSATLAGVIPSGTVSCTSDGTWTISGTDADNSDTITAGDTINLVFDNCDQGSVTVNGSISMGITQLVGDLTTPPYTLGVSVTLTNLSVTVDGHSATSSGDMSMLIEQDGSNNETYELSGSSLSSTVSGNTVTLSDYHYEFTLNDVSGAYSISLQGTFTSSEINGSVSYTTTTPFTGIEPGDPTAGALHITGDNGSQVWVTADSNGTTVYIDVDADGDGTAETQIVTTWADL
jgi:hypothetical protein